MNRYGEKVRAEWRKTGRRGTVEGGEQSGGERAGGNVEGANGSKWNRDGLGRVEKRDSVRGARKCGTEV